MVDHLIRTGPLRGDALKPGGLLIYATCSLLRDENQDVVDAVLKTTKTKAARTAPDVYLLPPTTDGFFIARLTRP